MPATTKQAITLLKPPFTAVLQFITHHLHVFRTRHTTATPTILASRLTHFSIILQVRRELWYEALSNPHATPADHLQEITSAEHELFEELEDAICDLGGEYVLQEGYTRDLRPRIDTCLKLLRERRGLYTRLRRVRNGGVKEQMRILRAGEERLESVLIEEILNAQELVDSRLD